MKKPFLLASSILSLLLVFLGVTGGLATMPRAEVLDFKVTVGASRDYEIIQYYETAISAQAPRVFSVETFTKDDGSMVNITIQSGTQFSVQVTAMNNSEMFGKITLEGHTLPERKITLPHLYLSSDGRYVMKTTTNLTYWEQEAVDNTDDADPNDWSKAWLEDDIFYLEVFSKHPDNSIDHDTLGVNWKTGWIEHLYDKSTFSNGSSVYEIEWNATSLEPSSEPSATSEEDSSGFEILPILAALLVTVEVTRRYSRR
ncbi:MAG: hypothetical protein ACXACI_05175 [Candidatus Hodarchaeales archaeon]|jgi:hypothetical protein